MKVTHILFLLATISVTASARADIIQSSTNSSYGARFFNPMGQAFTATAGESQVQVVSFLTGTIRPSAPDPVFRVELREGIGFTGSVVGSLNPPPIASSTPAATWIDFVFDTPLTLTPGQPYTLVFSPTNVGSVGMSYAGFHGNSYPGGTVVYLDGDQVYHEHLADLAFRVLSVPEPTVCALCMIACATVLLRRPARG